MTFFNFWKVMKWILAGALAIVSIVLTLALILGGLFFDVDASVVAPWFIGVIGIIFVLMFVVAVVSFICWFLGSRPYVIAILPVALILVFLGIIILWLIKKPMVDLGTYLQPIFSFLK